MTTNPQQRLAETNYKAKLFYEQKQKEHFEKFGCFFDTNCKIAEIIQEYHDQETKNFNTLYCFLYNDCIFESSHATISTHRTLEGANAAKRKHKNEKRREWKNVYNTLEDRIDMPFGKHESWLIHEIKVEE